jgi:hypothetical protein
VTAPDAVVYVNGSSEAIGCPSCKKKFPFNKYITSIQIDLSVDSVPGSASFTMSIPRHAVDDFFFDNTPIITEMMEVEIYAKGYYLVEGIPQYYPVFWGLVTEVNDSYSSGENTVTVHCADILKWWELTKMSTNSAMTSPNPGSLGMSLFGNVFYGMNPYDVIWTLAQQSFGDVIVGTGNLTSFYRESVQKNTFTAALNDIMIYWQQRFQKMRSALMLYGLNGVAVRGDTLYQAMRKANAKIGQAFASRTVGLSNGSSDSGGALYDPTSASVVAFRSNINANVPFWTSEYQTKLELATAAKDAIGFEFYMDVDGSIVFKPPFYNLDVLSNKPISWIQDIDVIDWDFSSSESEVVTQVLMQGNYSGHVDLGIGGEELTPMTSVTDYHLLRQYGWRSQTYNSEFLGNTNDMFYVGLDVLDRWNARRHRATVTIPMRSELRMGFPVYIASKDEIWYITGISHNIAFGGRATTTLTLTARRKKWIAPKGIGKLERTGFNGGVPATTTSNGNSNGTVQPTTTQLSRYATYKLTVGEAATFPPTTFPAEGMPSPYDPMILRHPKTGKIVGYPNAVMVFSRPFTAPQNDLLNVGGMRSSTQAPPLTNRSVSLTTIESRAATSLQQYFTQETAINADDTLRDKYLSNRYHYGLNSAGAYLYAHDVGGTPTGSSGTNPGYLQELTLFPSTNLTVAGTDVQNIVPNKGASALIRPVSDERGFEVVGAFAYGRGVALRDGRLIQQTGNVDAPATVSAQTALTGNLFAALNAQSQGLTSLTSSYSNPADALTRLEPEDLQTAGTTNNDGSAPTFMNTEDNFVGSTPLQSPQQQGLPSSVEVGLLSKGLTLAEMEPTTNDVQSDQTCPCLLGRSDLTFLSNGYQLKVLSMPNPATTDDSTLDPSSLFSGVTQSNQAIPVVDASTVTPINPQQVLNTIDNFLYTLYNTLDTVHQQYEAVLRGEPSYPNNTLSESDGNSSSTLAQNIAYAQTGGGTGELVPPYGSANRAALGDPTAIAQQGSTAISNLAQSFKAFGQNLQSNAQAAALQASISAAQSQIASLQSQIQKTQSASFYVGDKTSTLASLNAQLATQQKNLANYQSQLAALNGGS